MNAKTDLSLGQLARMAYDIREEKRDLDRQSKECGARLDEIKALIYAKLEEAGVDRTAVDGITLSKSDTVVPTVEDWDALGQFIVENNMLYLLQRRVSAATWKELLEDGVDVPGITAFTKQDVNIRAS
jgi:hypothetical protein